MEQLLVLEVVECGRRAKVCLVRQKGKDFASKGRKKGKNKDKDKEGYKDKGTGKSKNYKG